MGEFGRSGPQLPHYDAAQREHLKEVQEDLHRDQEADRVANGRSRRPTWRLGHLVVLVGAIGFVASCFLPYYGFEGPAQRTFSLYEQQTSGAFDGGSFGRLLYLFAGVLIAISIAVVGVARSEPQPRVPSMLIGAVAAWSLPWIGIMLSAAKRAWAFRLRSATGSKP